MIVYVGFAQRDEWSAWAGIYARHAERFEIASGRRCLIVPYEMADADLMGRLAPNAVVLSGFARSFETYEPADLAPVLAWIAAAETTPILAICGAHQLIGYLFNGETEGMRRLEDKPMRLRRPGEPIVNADYHPEHFMERGYYELHVLEPDPLFAACASPPVMMESHYCEIKRLPDGFRLLASTPECRIQAMRHTRRPLVGVQFHPEDYTDRFPDGRWFLEAFFAEACRRSGASAPSANHHQEES